jgi:hypothetical protein
MGVFERTGEIGVLFGWLVCQGPLALIRREAAISLREEFPSAVPLITLAGVLVLRLLVIRGPLRRASRIPPRTAVLVPVMIHLIRSLVRKPGRRTAGRPGAGGRAGPYEAASRARGTGRRGRRYKLVTCALLS